MGCRGDRCGGAGAALLVLAIALGGGEALAQGEAAPESSNGPSTQVWLNFTPGWSKDPRWYLELDVEHYPADWVDLLAEAPGAPQLLLLGRHC